MTLQVEKQPGSVQDELYFLQDWREPLLKAMTQGNWGLNFIRPINPPSKGCTWIPVAIKLFTKWVEAVAMTKATGCAPFNRWYSISHTTLTPYYPKGNGQAKVFNKRLLKILEKMTKENGKEWKEELPTVLWAHRTAKAQATDSSPFSLVYGTGAIIPIDSIRPVVKLVEIAGIPREDIGSCERNA
ncbi:uncharacterized protein LOC142628889 [Castanea sativa]|uniref:uncharacterized protein LOC142628889 n=1 Tax=Castanea sativa TaxID=21020 RepID=UPI003F64A9D9